MVPAENAEGQCATLREALCWCMKVSGSLSWLSELLVVRVAPYSGYSGVGCFPNTVWAAFTRLDGLWQNGIVAGSNGKFRFSRRLPKIDRVASESPLWVVGGKTRLLNSISRFPVPGPRAIAPTHLRLFSSARCANESLASLEENPLCVATFFCRFLPLPEVSHEQLPTHVPKPPAGNAKRNGDHHSHGSFEKHYDSHVCGGKRPGYG